jgi:DNA-binding NtrC family response regulator
MAKIELKLRDEELAISLAATLSRAGHDLMSTNSLEAPEVVVTDADTRTRELIEAHPFAPLILIADADRSGTAVEAMKAGAWDFVVQPVRADELIVRITRAIEHAQIMRENQTLRSRVPTEALAGQPLADVEKKIILSTLQQFRGHRLKTASALGIGVRTLGMKLKRWRQEGELVEA